VDGGIGRALAQSGQNPAEKVVVEEGVLFPHPYRYNRQKAGLQDLQHILLLRVAAWYTLLQVLAQHAWRKMAARHAQLELAAEQHYYQVPHLGEPVRLLQQVGHQGQAAHRAPHHPGIRAPDLGHTHLSGLSKSQTSVWIQFE